MSIIDTLITDRSAADTAALEALFAKAKAGTITEEEWAILANPAQKGAYNYTDLNRVISAMEYLRGRLEGYGYALKGYVQDTHVWQAEDNPKPAQMAQYIANVIAIRSVLELLSTTPEAPEYMEDLTVEEANAIEKILVDVETVIIRVVAGFARSDAFTMWSGNRPLPCTDSDRGRTWSELDGMKVPWVNLGRVDWYLLAYGHLRGDNA